jgi:catechol 2,3-dioxygenase-like lactoylglutathione lyase family enzyme
MQMGIVSARHVDHVGLVVPDLDAAIHFFEQALGALLLWRVGPIENIGEEDLVFVELFAFPDFEEISLNNWLRSMPVQVAAALQTFHRKRSA